jgi:hypothetical protein
VTRIYYRCLSIVWECQNDCFTESGSKMRSIGAMRIDQEFCEGLRTDPITHCGTWQCIVTAYSLRFLTMDSDKLPAIAGFARKFWSFSQEDVDLAGLWKKSLVDDMLWARKELTSSWHDDHINSHGERGGDTVAPPRSKLQRYRAPSWSWASVNSCVRWIFADTIGKGVYHTQLFGHGIIPLGDDEFGEIDGTHTTVKGPLWKLSEQLVFLLSVDFYQSDSRTFSHDE